jgi:hypothetical protein
MKCEHCNKEFKDRKGKRFCSDSCRVRSHEAKTAIKMNVKLVQKTVKAKANSTFTAEENRTGSCDKHCPTCGRHVTRIYNWLGGECLWCFAKHP